MNTTKNQAPLDPQLKQTLHPLTELPARDEAVAHERKQQFIKSAITARKQTVTFSSKPRLINQKLNNYRWRKPMSAKIIGIVMAILIVLGGAGIGTVAASQGSLPTETLYPVKQWSETVRLDLTANPDKKLDLSLDFADRRVDEYVEMIEEGITPPDSLLEQYQQNLEQAALLADETDDPQESKQRMQNRMRNQQNRMEMMQSVDPLMQQTQQMLQQQLHQMNCEEGEDCEMEPAQIQEQEREQLREDQPEGAGNPDANGYDGDYPDSGPHDDDDDDYGHYGNGNYDDDSDDDDYDDDYDDDDSDDDYSGNGHNGNGQNGSKSQNGSGNYDDDYDDDEDDEDEEDEED